MNDIQALVVRNDLSLPKERVDSLISLLKQRSLSYLSPEKEGGPFLLYCCGDDLETVALKTNYPIEVLLLTAMHYKWPSKVGLLQKSMADGGMLDIQKDMAKMLLIATHSSIQKQLGDVIAGRVDADKCPLIPKNIKGLNELMGLVNGITDKIREIENPSPQQVPITVHGTNIQINNGTEVSGKTKIERLKELANEE